MLRVSALGRGDVPPTGEREGNTTGRDPLPPIAVRGEGRGERRMEGSNTGKEKEEKSGTKRERGKDKAPNCSILGC